MMFVETRSVFAKWSGRTTRNQGLFAKLGWISLQFLEVDRPIKWLRKCLQSQSVIRQKRKTKKEGFTGAPQVMAFAGFVIRSLDRFTSFSETQNQSYFVFDATVLTSERRSMN
jgi:hypothetical protein